MIFLLALLPATMIAIAGYGALFLSERSVGNLRTAGRLLGFWTFTLSALVVIGGIIGAARAPHLRELRMRSLRMNPAAMRPGPGMPQGMQPGLQPGPQPNGPPGPAPQPGSPPPAGAGSSGSAPPGGR